MSFYDYKFAVNYENREKRCPICKSENIRFIFTRSSFSRYTCGVYCNECKHESSITMYNGWGKSSRKFKRRHQEDKPIIYTQTRCPFCTREDTTTKKEFKSFDVYEKKIICNTCLQKYTSRSSIGWEDTDDD